MRPPLVPCADCSRRLAVDALHDRHEGGCAVATALTEDRPITDDEYELCTCPERLVCHECCPHCTPTEGNHHDH